MRIFSYILVSFLFTVTFFSCKKETAEPVEMGYKYFPVNTGHWVVYDVDSVSYNDFTGTVDTFRYQVKEYVESVFTDNSGRPGQRLERYSRYSDTAAWKIKDVWVETLTSSCAERVEENLRIIKLIFPVRESLRWNGNNYNMLGEQMYKYQDVHKAATINNKVMDSTVTVIQKNVSTLISEDFQEEIYAAHIGLVYKKFVSLEKEPVGTIKSGTDYTYTIHSYGN